MALYHFHIDQGGVLLRDDEGEDFQAEQDAIRCAVRLAIALAGEGEFERCELVLTDRFGNELQRFPISKPS